MLKRPKIAALEKNILKYRALQMVLLLHEVESLKSFVLNSIRATDNDRFTRNKRQRLPEKNQKVFSKVWALLVNENIITTEESDDIQKIIEIRNEIGHSIHNLVLDISCPESANNKKTYDYSALDRFEKYKKKISEGMRKKFLLVITFRESVFEQAENTYKEELRRLRKKIERQYKIRRKKYSKNYVV